MAGNRCDIYEKIDELDGVTTVKELVTVLKPILNQLAYYMIQSEGVALEDSEAWHEEFADHLYEATSQEHAALAQKGRAAPAGPREQFSPRRGPSAAAPGAPLEAGEERRGPPPLASRAPPARPRPVATTAGLSPSLLAIMQGTHPSFKETD